MFRKFHSFIIITYLAVGVFSLINAENGEVTLSKIKKYSAYFYKAAKIFNINADYLKAIVYVERTENMDWRDEALDILLAKKGYNSSVGFCQIKLKTAYWIEIQLSDSASEFFPGKKYKALLKISKTNDELIKKLQNDSLNILYAAAYLRIIQSYWTKLGFSIDNKPEILGTLYSAGLFNSDGTIRNPNAKPKENQFGIKVIKILNIF
ncbi:MAG: hypothetical protein D6707_06025 [Bacteroidetes bacterium]|nr:MAG: hypothetical protein D6707_06025 [Bacteroidota bacterium]